MKSFVSYPVDFNKALFPQASTPTGKLIAHYELYKKVKDLEGAVVKCGISAEEGFSRFTKLHQLSTTPITQKMLAFEKSPKLNFDKAPYAINNQLANSTTTLTLQDQIDFIPGYLGDAIPNYLIENPDLKISFLNIDLDDYDSTLTALEFFYPRLMPGGILIIDNYYKLDQEYKAVNDYFYSNQVNFFNFSVNKGPHYLIRG